MNLPKAILEFALFSLLFTLWAKHWVIHDMTTQDDSEGRGEEFQDTGHYS